jgi:hypothetical protein
LALCFYVLLLGLVFSDRVICMIFYIIELDQFALLELRYFEANLYSGNFRNQFNWICPDEIQNQDDLVKYTLISLGDL